MNVKSTEPAPENLSTAEPFPLSDEVRVLELRYRRLFEAARDGIFLLDIDSHKITDANPFMAELLGYSREELIGREPWELGVFSDKTASKEAFHVVQTDGYLRYDHLPLKTKDGEIREVEFVSNVYDEDDVQVIQCNIRDLTRRRKLEKQSAATEERFKTLFDHAPDGILIANAESYYLEANASMCQMLGYSREELIGLHAENIVIPSEVKYIDTALQDLQAAHDHHRVWQFRRKDGTDFAGDVLVTAMPDGNLLAVVRDITERLAYQERLTQSQSNLASAQHIAHFGSWEMDLPLNKGRGETPLRWSDEVFRIFGYRPGEIEVTNDNFFRAAHPDDRELIKTAMADALREKKSYAIDHRILLPDGTERVVMESSEIVFDPETGEPVKMIGTVQDITERKRIERELAETAAANVQSLALIDTILANAPIGFAFHDCDLRYVRINETLAAINGLPVEEHLGRELREVVPDMAPILEPIMLKVIETGEPEVDFQLSGATRAEPDAVKHWVVSFYPVGKEGTPLLGVGVLVTEITERKKAEEELRNSEEKFAGAFEFAPVGVALVSLDGRWYQVNRSLCELIGYSEEELLKLTFQDVTHPDDLEAHLGNLKRLIDGEITFYQMEKRYIHKLGSVVLVLLNVSLVRDEKGEPRYFIAQIQDIAERKHADDSLRESESLLAASQRITHLGSWVIDLEGDSEIKQQAERWSDEHYRIFGYEPGEVELSDEFFYNAVHPDDREGLATLIREAIAEGKSFDTEHRIILPDGSERTVQAMAELVLDKNTGKPIKLLGSVQDITGRKRAEEEIQRQQTELRVLFDLMPAMIWFKDTENNILRVNQRVAEAAGLTVREIEGRSALEIYPEQAAKFYVDDQTILASGKAKLGYVEMLSDAAGQKRWVQTDKVPYFDAGGEPIGIVVMAQDVTERKNAEDALVASEERYRSVVETAPDVIVTIDDASTICFINPAAERTFGYSPDELKGASLTMLMPERLRPRHNAGIERYRETGVKHVSWEYVELTGLHKSGREIPITISFSEFVQNGHRFFTGIIRDISERKQAMEALRESEERYRELFENAIDIIYTHDLSGNYTSVNKAVEAITGYTRDEALVMNITDTVAPESAEKASKMIAAKLAGEKVTAYELELIAKDGHTVAVEVNTRIVYDGDTPVAVQGIARDITSRKQIEAALKSSEASFKSLFDTANDAIMVLSEGWLLDCNHRSELLFNCSKANIIGHSPLQFSPTLQPDGQGSSEKCKMYMGLALEGVPQFFEWQYLRGNGTLFDAEVSLNRVNFGGAAHLQAIVRDITDRKLSEAALAAAEENYRSIFENAVEGIFQSSRSGQFISANPAMARILGYDSAEELMADRTDILTQHYVDPECRVALERILEDDDVAKGFECEVFRRDRSTIWTQENIRTVRGVNGEIECYEGSLEDITERKSLEGQLRQSQKMEAVGVLAGGIAHDFNNLLTAINGYSSLTLKKMAPGDPFRHNIQEVKNAGDRAAELTSQLLAFSRKQVLQPVVINLNTVVSNIEKMLRRIIRESIELRFVLDPGLTNIKADPGQIEQVLMNLAINARDAMPDGGTLTVETQNVLIDEHYVSQHVTVAPGEFIKMTVTDTGDGMSAETQSHIFEPFFTTKDVGKGTGLGLSTVYGIIKQSGGDIRVYSELGHGTTFKIYLPCVGDAIQKRAWATEVASGAGSETILLVEDEAIVRVFVRTILSENGYTVLEASSGADALALAHSHSGPIHMLLTDLIMPKMSGTELKDQLFKIRPDIRNLFMSGYTDESISHQGILNSGTAFIEKPFSPDALFRKVREVLEA